MNDQWTGPEESYVENLMRNEAIYNNDLATSNLKDLTSHLLKMKRSCKPHHATTHERESKVTMKTMNIQRHCSRWTPHKQVLHPFERMLLGLKGLRNFCQMEFVFRAGKTADLRRMNSVPSRPRVDLKVMFVAFYI